MPLDPRRPPEQSSGHRHRSPARTARLRDRRERQREEQLGARRAAGQSRGSVARTKTGAAEVDGVPRDPRLRGSEARAGGRSDPRSARPLARAPPPTSGSGTTSARLFAGATESRIRGYGPSRFSFNVAAGGGDACEGQGMQRIEMSFLPDVRVPCDACGGRRFTPETLEIRYLDMSIAEVLGSSVDEALPGFEAQPARPSHVGAVARRRARLSHPRPEQPHVVGRRSAAHQARHRTRQGSTRPHRRAAPAGRALRARRADHRAAHGGRGETRPGAAPVGGCRQPPSS